jgi:hypothetical protein
VWRTLRQVSSTGDCRGDGQAICVSATRRVTLRRVSHSGGDWPMGGRHSPTSRSTLLFCCQIFRRHPKPTTSSPPSSTPLPLFSTHPSPRPLLSSLIDIPINCVHPRRRDSLVPSIPVQESVSEIRESRFTTPFPVYTCRASRNPFLIVLPCLTAADTTAVVTATPMGTWLSLLALDATLATSPSKPV